MKPCPLKPDLPLLLAGAKPPRAHACSLLGLRCAFGIPHGLGLRCAFGTGLGRKDIMK